MSINWFYQTQFTLNPRINFYACKNHEYAACEDQRENFMSSPYIIGPTISSTLRVMPMLYFCSSAKFPAIWNLYRCTFAYQCILEHLWGEIFTPKRFSSARSSDAGSGNFFRFQAIILSLLCFCALCSHHSSQEGQPGSLTQCDLTYTWHRIL